MLDDRLARHDTDEDLAIVDHGRVLASGRLDDLLGAPQAHVRVADLPPAARAEATRWGAVTWAGDDELTVDDIDPGVVPDLVAWLVGAGGRVHEVEVRRSTLEERFMDLIGRHHDEPAP